jgi:hypothetical protein
MNSEIVKSDSIVFDGMIYFFCCFDIGDDIDFKSISTSSTLFHSIYKKSRYKTQNILLSVDIKKIELNRSCISASLYNFGVLSLRYAFHYSAPLEELKNIINKKLDLVYKHSYNDAKVIFNEIKDTVRDPVFFNLSKTYVVIQCDTKDEITPYDFKTNFGHEISSLLRFETEVLSEYKKNEILENGFGYYRGDLLIIDVNSALVYDNDYGDVLDIFEYANIKHMELQVFDRSLDTQLNFSYDRRPFQVSVLAYLPIIGMMQCNPIEELAKLRVDISVVCERLWSSIKFSDDPYYLEIYHMLDKKLEFDSWQKSIDKKLEIISHILETHEYKITNMRHDFQNILIILLIFLETVLAVLHFFFY